MPVNWGPGPVRCPTPSNFITMSTLEFVAVSTRLVGELKENVFGIHERRPAGEAAYPYSSKGDEGIGFGRREFE